MSTFFYSIRRVFFWILDHLAGTVVSLFILAILATGIHSHVSAAVSYDVAAEPQMFLDTNMTTTNTTGIILAAPQWNGSSVVFTTKSGGILRIRQGSKREDIRYTSATVDGTTYKVTLVGVTRNICPNNFFQSVTCGIGQQFSRGATVELNNDPRLFNTKANQDRANLFTASGAINFPLDASGSLGFPVYTNTTTRDHNIQVKDGKTACSKGDGTCSFYIAGGWSTFGTSTTSNATESAAGKVQLASLSDQSGSVANGSSGAPDVARTKYMSASGGILFRKYSALFDNRGYMSGSTLASNFRSLTAATQATNFLRGDQTFAKPSASGSTIAADKEPVKTPNLVNGTSASWAMIDNTNLSQSIAGWSVGDTASMNFNCSAIRGGGTSGWGAVDMQIGNNPVTLGNSGALALSFNSTEQTLYKNMSFSILNRVMTGGTLTFAPVYKVGGGASLGVTFGIPCMFQVLKIH